jgi:hypothetical protein
MCQRGHIDAADPNKKDTFTGFQHPSDGVRAEMCILS